MTYFLQPAPVPSCPIMPLRFNPIGRVHPISEHRPGDGAVVFKRNTYLCVLLRGTVKKGVGGQPSIVRWSSHISMGHGGRD